MNLIKILTISGFLTLGAACSHFGGQKACCAKKQCKMERCEGKEQCELKAEKQCERKKAKDCGDKA